jgi:hypothetical protein
MEMQKPENGDSRDSTGSPDAASAIEKPNTDADVVVLSKRLSVRDRA